MPEVAPRDQSHSECKVVIYMSHALKEELQRRARGSNCEGYSCSKLVRSALREYFKRHSAP